MPPHEYLETKRRQNIRHLNATGACHICGSSCRHSGGLSRLVDEAAPTAATQDEVASMRTCGCNGSTWPYSLRVCDVCIKDDAASLTGRVRHCGICGVVACDEDCGVELVECTDVESWNNAGCLECRKMEAFREIEIFRTPPPMDCQNIIKGNNSNAMEDDSPPPLPRMTRVCTKCLTSFTPWVKYDFVCRRFKCETRLVPSDIAERKRYCLLASARSPILKILPEDGLVAIVDFLAGDELCNLLLTSSAMCIVAERVAKTRVENVADQFPTGPICISSRKCFVRENVNTDAPTSSDPRTEIRPWIYASNEHDFGLRAPDDSKTWVGVYHYMERMTGEDFYFGFQSHRDDGAVCRFLRQPTEEKFAFGESVFCKVGQDLVMNTDLSGSGIAVRGGQVSMHEEGVLYQCHMTFPSNQVLTGEEKQRFIGRLFCPGSGNLNPPSRDVLGAVGALRINRSSIRRVGEIGREVDEVLPNATWLQKINIMEGWRDDSVFGFEYDPTNRLLSVVFGSSRINRSTTSEIRLTAEEVESGGDVVLAIELTPKAAKQHTLLSVRKCDADVWSRFLEHLPEEVPLPQAVAEEGADEAVLMAMDAEERDDGMMVRRIRRRIDHMRARRRHGEVRRRTVAARAEPVIADNQPNANMVEFLDAGEAEAWDVQIL